MRNEYKNYFKDSRILLIYIKVIIAIIAGVTYALESTSIAFNLENYDLDDNCYRKDWLLYSANLQWTIFQYSADAGTVFGVDSDVYANYNGVNHAKAV